MQVNFESASTKQVFKEVLQPINDFLKSLLD
jgi:hypothetical protein